MSLTVCVCDAPTGLRRWWCTLRTQWLQSWPQRTWYQPATGQQTTVKLAHTAPGVCVCLCQDLPYDTNERKCSYSSETNRMNEMVSLSHLTLWLCFLLAVSSSCMSGVTTAQILWVNTWFHLGCICVFMKGLESILKETLFCFSGTDPWHVHAMHPLLHCDTSVGVLHSKYQTSSLV